MYRSAIHYVTSCLASGDKMASETSIVVASFVEFMVTEELFKKATPGRVGRATSVCSNV